MLRLTTRHFRPLVRRPRLPDDLRLLGYEAAAVAAPGCEITAILFVSCACRDCWQIRRLLESRVRVAIALAAELTDEELSQLD